MKRNFLISTKFKRVLRVLFISNFKRSRLRLMRSRPVLGHTNFTTSLCSYYNRCVVNTLMAVDCCLETYCRLRSKSSRTVCVDHRQHARTARHVFRETIGFEPNGNHFTTEIST